MNNSSPYINSHIASAAELKNDAILPLTNSTPPSYTAPPPDQEDDDSIIKCICNFKHDDGSSVFCEKCNTWQHTECYYYIEEEDRVPNKDELEAILHFCTDCKPRPLDIQAAVNRQRPRVPEVDQDERKAKKPVSKSHKKKTKTPEANGALTNGWSHDLDGLHDRTSRSPRDSQTQTKRPKTGHRSSTSMSVPALSHIPTSHPHRRSGSTINSPSKVPGKHTPNGLIKGLYTGDFMHLYDNDPGDHPMQTNLLSDINITGDLSLWTYDAEALKEATRGFSHADVFHRMDRPLSDMMGPPPRKEYMDDESVMIDGQHPRWFYLKSDVFTEAKTIVGEIKGKIGHMKEYIQEPANRWDYLRHPAPFVLFHPRLPIYIDTRAEGTICRYLRRSCRPNLIMTTFLENESEYHFCFTAKHDIPAGAELTIGWVLDEHMRKFNYIKNDMAQDIGAGGEEYITDWVSKVFPEFGGCACGAPDDCWLSGRIKASTKGRATYIKQKQSPPNQAMKAKDDSDRDDERSTSGSKSGSRDMTPTGPHNGEYGLGLGLENSDREKRKIAALEKNFEQLENDKQQPATKKKKRNSGGSSVNTPGAVTSVGIRPNPSLQAQTDLVKQKQLGHSVISFSQPNTPALASRSQYADASTSRRKSDSPTGKPSDSIGRPRNSNAGTLKNKISQSNTPTNPSPLAQPNYVSTAVQTDIDDGDDWYKPPAQSLRPKIPYLSLTKRLLLRSQHDRQKLEERRRSAEVSPNQKCIHLQENISGHDPQSSPSHEDVEMADAEPTLSSEAPYSAECMQASVRTSGVPISQSPTELKPPAWPSQPAQSFTDQSVAGDAVRSTELPLQPPLKPLQLSDPSSNNPPAQIPASTLSQSPLTQAPSSYSAFLASSGGPVPPSSAKKKVSLSDYIKRKGSHSTDSKPMSGSPEMSHSTLRNPFAISTTNGQNLIEGSPIVDTPRKEECNPLNSTSEGTTSLISTTREGKPR